MVKANDNFRDLRSYLFSEVGKRLKDYSHGEAALEVIRMDIGDVTHPLAPAVTEAMHRAVDEMTASETFRGYGPEQGYAFLREAISENDYRNRGIEIDASEIFISDGAKSDLGNLPDILGDGLKIAIADPSYPAYVDSTVINGNGGKLEQGRWNGIMYLECSPEKGFLPELPAERPDVIIMCYPNNPTGTSITAGELGKWIAYAREKGCLVIYDSAYEAYISSPEAVRSVYEIPGAKEVAIEVRSFSKTAGFTGLRCGYTVVPKELKAMYSDGVEVGLNSLWNRRQCTKFNGASYIVQRGAEAIYTPEGKAQTRETVRGYMDNSQLIRNTLREVGFEVFGGTDAPYVWARHPEYGDSWGLFGKLLEEAGVSCTPGVGFGKSGEGYVRFTGFNTREKTREAMGRIKGLFGKEKIDN